LFENGRKAFFRDMDAKSHRHPSLLGFDLYPGFNVPIPGRNGDCRQWDFPFRNAAAAGRGS
jgi:hypothetical protein